MGGRNAIQRRSAPWVSTMRISTSTKHLRSTNKRVSPKWALEAWLLTGECPDYISQETAQPIETIIWYSKLFFDVQDRLNAPSFIVRNAIGPKIYRGLTPQDVGVIWRHFAYGIGPGMVEQLVGDFVEADKTDYLYLFDGTYQDADLTPERRDLHQAIRVLLMPAMEVLRMVGRAVQDPEVRATATSWGDVLDVIATSGTRYLHDPERDESAAPGGDSGAMARSAWDVEAAV